MCSRSSKKGRVVGEEEWGKEWEVKSRRWGAGSEQGHVRPCKDCDFWLLKDIYVLIPYEYYLI